MIFAAVFLLVASSWNSHCEEEKAAGAVGGIQIDSRDDRGESACLVEILDGFEMHRPEQGHG